MKNMKTYILFLIVSITISTSCSKKQNLILTDKEWEGILNTTITVPAIDEKLIYSNYCNKRLDDLVAFCYEEGSTMLGYQLSDSISNYLKIRDDKQIKNKLDTIFGIKFINDKEKFEKKHLIFSEPFFINEGLVCFSIGLIGEKDKALNQWVFFLKKNGNYFTSILYYDYLTGKFYELVSVEPK